MGFSREEYWSGLLCPPAGDLPDPGIESHYIYLHWQQVLYHWSHRGSPNIYIYIYIYIYTYTYIYILTCVLCLVIQSCLTAILWTVAHQAPLSMGFPKQEHWRGLPFPTPRDLPYPGIKLALQAASLPMEPLGKPIYLLNHVLYVTHNINSCHVTH